MRTTRSGVYAVDSMDVEQDPESGNMMAVPNAQPPHVQSDSPLPLSSDISFIPNGLVSQFPTQNTLSAPFLDSCLPVNPGSVGSSYPSKVHQDSVAETISTPNTLSSMDSDLVAQELLLQEEELQLKRKRLMLTKLKQDVSQRPPELKPSIVNDSAVRGAQPDLVGQLLSRLTSGMVLPKIEIEPFSGSADDFVTFISTFSSQIEPQLSDPYQKLCYLIYYCRGVAKEAIKHCTLLPADTCFRTALEILRSQFGRPHQVIQSVTQSVFTGPVIRSNDVASLQVLLRQMRSCSIILNQLDRSDDLNCSTNLIKIVRRLPKPIQNKWAEIAEAFLSMGKSPTFDDLLSLIEKRVSIGMTEYGMIASENAQSAPLAKPYHRIATVKQLMSGQSCPLCGVDHQLDSCSLFMKMDSNHRWQSLKEHKRCFRCLKGNHRIRECKSRSVCRVDGCIKMHHPLLHTNSTTNRIDTHDEAHVCTSYGLHPTGIQLGFVPVRLRGPRGTVSTYAFLDNGSDCTLVDRTIANKIGLVTTPTSLRISTLHGVKSISCGKTKAKLISIDENFGIDLESLIVVDQLPIRQVDKPHTNLSRWPHLKDIAVNTLPSNLVGILIGCDVPEAHEVHDQRIGRGKEPFAYRSAFGWVVRGPLGSRDNAVLHVNTIAVTHQSTQELLHRLYDSEFQEPGDPEEVHQSIDDQKALQSVASSARLVDGHYELTVPWKGNQYCLPDNRLMALNRLNNLKQKLKRDESLRYKYVQAMRDHMRKGHVSLGSCEPRRWFLPHHPVINHKKPEKLRIVFDCAAKYQGFSLNDKLSQGPDLINKLTGVLLRFRLYAVALSADIREMFLQVKLPEIDRKAFSFLWWQGNDLNNQPEVYEWNVHPFGATSSPFCANYVLRRTIEDNVDEFPPLVGESVIRSFYVDDFLFSSNTVEEAKSIVLNLPKLLKCGGFELVKWTSNNEDVLECIDPTTRAHSLEELRCGDLCQRTLGVKWHVTKDVFMFDMITPAVKLTRRTLLAYIASIYDPCGFIAPALLPGKMILQELCRSNVGWDVELNDTTLCSYFKWLDLLRMVQSLEIPRCLIPNLDTNRSYELHVFSDASEYGYGAVAYLRQVYNDVASCHLLMGKSRVAPLKFVTIPRLELTAALVATKLSAHITKEISIDLDKVVMWTDSMLVLRYLSNTCSRYATFVANRVRRIQELSGQFQWKYVPTEQNPADLASRGLSKNSFHKLKWWLEGPEYLHHSECSWPSLPNNSKIIDDEMELKRVVFTLDASANYKWLNELSARSREWMGFLRRVVYLTRFKHYLMMKQLARTDVVLQLGYIKGHELLLASRDVIRIIQSSNYGTKTPENSKRSRECWPVELRRLKPVEVEGIFCLGGRVRIHTSSKALPILPSRERITELIVQHHHERCGHAGPAHVLASVRREFWLIKGMSTVRRILSRCIECRALHSPLCQQAMAPLPSFRTEGGLYPFSHTGLDYFGPFHVSMNRRRFKRYGCLFTCMQTRAIHIEVVHSMCTDSFLMALHRFICRRGNPITINSDNGSNFVGAETELRSICESLNKKQINDALVVQQIEWNFNPPFASHRGGVWERMIRTVRKILTHLLKEQTVTDEVLLTSLAEAERLVNDRPLIPVYDDPEQPEILRPNDLLLLRTNPGLVYSDIPLRERMTKQWRQAQYLSDSFWKRWRREYLPTLQQTHRWLRPHRNLRLGDLVLLSKIDAPRGQWPKGVISETYPGTDGLVRKVLVRTSTGVVRRDVRTLCLLEGAEE